MAKETKTKRKQWSANYCTGNWRLNNSNLTETGLNSGVPERPTVPVPLVVLSIIWIISC